MSLSRTKPNRLWPILWLSACCLPALAWGEDRALLISIADYQVPRFALQGPHNDAQTFKTLLKDKLMFKDSQIKILQDSEATKVGILAALDYLVKATGKGDRVVLYYSGHGEQMPDDNNDEIDGKDEALLPYDTAENPKDQTNWVRDDEISQRVAQLADRKVLAVFDSCHSGTVTRGAFDYDDAKRPNWGATRSAAEPILDKAHQQEGGFIDGGGNVIALFAVAPNQEAIDDRAEPVHSVFTEALVTGAKGAANLDGDKILSYNELLEFTRIRTSEYCKNHKNSKACANNPSPMFEMDSSLLSTNFLEFGQSSAVNFAAPANATDALAHQGDATLSLTMQVSGETLPEGGTVQLGKTVSYRFSTDHAGRLVIFDVDATGKLTQLFPYPVPDGAPPECQKSLKLADWVPANKGLNLPDNCMGMRLTAQEPTGPGKVVAVLIEDAEVDTEDLIALQRELSRPGDSKGQQAQGLSEQANGGQWMQDLRVRLNAIIHQQDGKNRAARWSIATASYAITQ